MKKRILLLVMVITMLVSAVVLAITSSAACTITTSSKNIASDGTVTTSSNSGEVIVENLIDGKNTNGTYTRHGSFTITFPTSKNLAAAAIFTNHSKLTVYSVQGYDDDGFPKYKAEATETKLVKVKIQFLSDTDEILWDSGEIDISEKSGLVTIQATDVYLAKKVVFHLTDNNYGWGPLGELLVYEGSGAHDWKLDETVNTTEQPYVPATCTEDGMGTYKCECNAVKYATIYQTGHIESSYIPDYDNPGNHYTTCLNANSGTCSLEAGARISEGAHVYDHDCDTNCNLCDQKTRDVEGHLYVSDCDVHCNKCEELRQPVNGAQHIFAYTCTPKCENCNEPNPNWIDHTYDSDCDATCNFCQTERVVNPHVYNSACDEDCNVAGCGHVRTTVDDPDLIPHSFTSDCDTNCNNENCIYVRQPLIEHPFQNRCDKNCNACNALNPDYIEGHVYDNDCDDRCNECPVKRTVDDHKYDNLCDIDCNTCGKQRTVSKHIYGEWKTLIPASETAEGIRAHYCVNCDKEEQEILPMLEKTGLSTGAIVGIVAGSSVVVLGCAGVGVYSLVIKPKMELKQRQALEAEKKKAQEADDDEEYEDDEDSES